MGFEYKDELKNLLPDYMELLEEQGKVESRGDGFYTCPFCDSGNKSNLTAAFHIKDTKYTCFSCGEHGDIFDLVAYIEELPNDWKKHYNRVLKIMHPYLEGDKPKKNREKYISGFLDLFEPTKSTMDYLEYLHRCHENVSKTDYFTKRGLNEKIIDRFNLGYDAKKKVVTIPYDKECKGYVHRALWDCDNKYCKYGNEIFNIDALYAHRPDNILSGDYVFITEGQIDAMSFEEIGISATALGGVNEVSKLVKQLMDNPCNKILVLALDNDKAGRRATGKFIEELAEAELKQEYIVISNLYRKYKDANDFLVADREGFIDRIKKVVSDSRHSLAKSASS